MPLAGNEYHPYNMEQPDINTANLPEVIEAGDLGKNFGNDESDRFDAERESD